MSLTLNKAQLLGNLTRDPELRATPAGTSVCSFTVATNHSWTDQNGQKKEKAEFHNIVAWGKLAEIVSNYLHKGDKLFLEGRIQTRDWEGEDGKKNYKTEIIADNVIMLPKGGGARTYDEIDNGNTFGNEEISKQETESEEISIDDLPF